MMKRFFTFLMAVWAFLSISQTVKAVDVTVYFQCPSGWGTTVHEYAYNSGSDANTSSWPKASAGSKFSSGTSLSKSVNNSAFTYTLAGSYNSNGNDMSKESTSFDFDGNDKYTYTFTATQTGTYCFRIKTSYGSGAALCPETNASKLTSTPTDVSYTDKYGKSNNYWTYEVTAGKKYTFTLLETKIGNGYTRKLSVVPEETVVTKVIKLFNGSSEVTGSNGKYTLDLSGETSTNATITLTIDGKKYGLAEAKTISAVGITSDIAFTEGASEVLTLKTGFVYTLIVAEDGKMKVVARQRGAADGSYYLVGNFFNEDGENINYDKKYFRFINNKGDGNLYFDIPASLTVKAQVYGADGKCYGPKDNKEIGIDKPASTDDVTANGEMVAGKDNYWSFTDRGFVEGKKQVGIYRVTIKVDEETGVPSTWNITYDKTKRMAYFLVDPDEDIDAVAQPCYTDYLPKENPDKKWSNNFYGNIYLEAGQHCFVVGNIQKQANDGEQEKPLNTTTKLYLQGNGGLDPTTNTGSGDWHYTNVFPNKAGFCYGETKSMVLEYNPSKGNGDYLSEGIGGEILKAHNQITDQNDPITSIQIVGKGVVDSWDLDKAQVMKYNKTLDCWEYKFRTEKEESVDNKFRFIANNDWKYNWGEESLAKKDQARPYTDTNPENGHEASLKDPNELGFTKAGTADERNGEGTFADMYFNRPAGEWTIRFYIRTILDESGNNYKAVYAYTITGSASNDVILTYCNGQFIRTYSNNKAMNPVDDNVKIYEVYRYDKPAEETEPGKVDNIYAKGTVHLRRLNYIPANVGVVLIGVVPAGGEYAENQQLAFSLLERTEDPEIAPTDSCKLWMNAETYTQRGDKWNNYLVPTVQANNNLGNAYVDKSGKVTYRYFGLSNYYRTKYHYSLGTADTQPDYLGFFRLTSNGKSGANKAYLSIPANAEVGNGVGATYGYIDFNGQLLENKFHDQYEAETPAKFANMAMIFDDLIEGNETTGIKELETEVLNDNKYYNLQGIEVAYPVKGIYIHNGKKVIVK